MGALARSLDLRHGHWRLDWMGRGIARDADHQGGGAPIRHGLNLALGPAGDMIYRSTSKSETRTATAPTYWSTSTHSSWHSNGPIDDAEKCGPRVELDQASSAGCSPSASPTSGRWWKPGTGVRSASHRDFS